ncbi:Hypothetical predicted protein [Mytilus galloprovincialis]|uniref:Reverse transcriptase domain-containing protein n=1 Tax=Mytilus galloprovincialis TaxID=29158 RepID=A0A8B6C6J9_MYTGA|nr:Hypothetical predicted protein [Mytilus galloprovincialis]
MEPWDVITSVNDSPFAMKTLLGWVINGPLDVVNTDQVVGMFVSSNRITANQIFPSLEDQLCNHFNYDFSERTIDDENEPSKEDKQFLDIASKSSSLVNGHYVIDLPFKSKDVQMPNNRKQAEQRLIALSKRFTQDHDFHKQYVTFMDKVINEGYAIRVPEKDNGQNDGSIWYLPHHGVFHPKKMKLRVVFDCAARFKGTSLNDQLLQGPNLTNTLIGTLIRFRQEEIAIMGDIDSMFYQVRVPSHDSNFLRFL